MAASPGNAFIIIHREGSDEKIAVQYNPSEYSIDHSVKYNTQKGISNTPKQSFVGRDEETLNFRITLDGFTMIPTSDESKAADVSKEVAKIKALLQIDEKLHRPPECSFQWGSMDFRGIVQKLSVRYTMFNAEGKPIRAVVEMALHSQIRKKIAYRSPDRSKQRVLAQDTPLYMMAQEAYGTPAAWRPIAQANGIRNPRKLETGALLRVPPLEERHEYL